MTLARQLLSLALFVAVCFVAAGVGSIFTSAAIPQWYAGLQKPAWTPPNWLFGPVWSALYLMMALAAWLVWREKGKGRAAVAPALWIFALQLILNVLWSVIFFGMRLPGVAFVEIVALWAAILATLLVFWRVSRPAGLLLLPYLLWVTYAATLNFGIWQMNS